jgi:hypothetical protein
MHHSLIVALVAVDVTTINRPTGPRCHKQRIVRNEGARHGSAPLAVPLRSMGAPDVNARMSRNSKRTQTQEALSKKRTRS